MFELVHSNICGRMSVESNTWSFATFINDYSKMAQIYFLKTKVEVFSEFQEFKALVENQVGMKIKVLRSDNGAE